MVAFHRKKFLRCESVYISISIHFTVIRDDRHGLKMSNPSADEPSC
jgi:hypothetical protein